MQNALLHREGEDHRLIPGLWRNAAVMQEMDEVRVPTGEIGHGKHTFYLICGRKYILFYD